MSSTAFQDQLETVLTILNNSYDLCQLIRNKRRTGSTTPHLDAFQSSLITTKQNLNFTFSSIRQNIGSRFDLGDTLSRDALNSSIRNLQSQIQNKLSAVAYGHERHGGFQALLYQLQTIEQTILSVFSSLKYRLETTPLTPKAEKPKPILKKTKTDEVVIGIKKLDLYIDHMKNSWVETSVDGEVFYVNVFDEKRKQWERPANAFIQSLPKPEKPKRRSTWEKDLERERERQKEREQAREREREREREERRRRADPWRNNGW